MAVPEAFHESYKREENVKPGSERSFGVVFFVVFAVSGLWPLLSSSAPRWWSLAMAGCFLVVALVRPALLAPLNRGWFLFGLLLHRIVTPLTMGIIFFLTITPTGLIMRLLGKDPLRLRLDRNAKTYWIERKPPGPNPETMRNQY